MCHSALKLGTCLAPLNKPPNRMHLVIKSPPLCGKVLALHQRAQCKVFPRAVPDLEDVWTLVQLHVKTPKISQYAALSGPSKNVN